MDGQFAFVNANRVTIGTTWVIQTAFVNIPMSPWTPRNSWVTVCKLRVSVPGAPASQRLSVPGAPLVITINVPMAPR